jgi:antirestriction protein
MNITFYSLSDYNNGTLISKTFEIDDYETYEEFDQARTAWLDELTEALDDGELREEYIVADSDEIPDEYVGEWTLSAELWDFLDVVNSGLDVEVVKAGVDYGIPLDKIEDAYFGEFENDEELARECLENSGLLEDVPATIANYFDYEAYGRDLSHDFSQSGNYYFHSSF